MTKTTATSEKSPQKDSTNHQSADHAGRNGVVQAPPAYGIDFVDNAPIQRVAAVSAPSTSPQSTKQNRNSLPTPLKTGIEALSGLAMDDVMVHYNSPKPAQLQAHAYAQGNDIHLGSGQEKHLPHEAWHVVQQKQGKVKPTLQMKGLPVNTDAGLEKEADVMGQKATHSTHNSSPIAKSTSTSNQPVVQAKIYWGGKDLNQNEVQDELLESLQSFIAVEDLFTITFQLKQDLMVNRSWIEFGGDDDHLSINEIVATVSTVYEENRRTPLVIDNYKHIVDSIFIQKIFIPRLNRLIAGSEGVRGENVRLLEIADLLDEVPASIERAFADFVDGREGGIISQILSTQLKQVFGFDRVQNLLDAVGMAGSNNLKFETKGITKPQLTYSIGANRNLYNRMRAKYDTEENADKFLPGVIYSGADFPVEKAVRAGDKYYKLMAPGANFMWPPSPYYLAEDELEAAIRETNLLEHRLGLPLTSYAPVYFVYEIEALEDNEVFESTIAPTVQKVAGQGQVAHRLFENAGGRKQTLIVDSSNTQRWWKNPNPVKIYDPVEPTRQDLQTFSEKKLWE